MPSSRGPSQLRDGTCLLPLPALAGRFFTTSSTWEVPTAAHKSEDPCKDQKKRELGRGLLGHQGRGDTEMQREASGEPSSTCS